jgi:hypothetical protein
LTFNGGLSIMVPIFAAALLFLPRASPLRRAGLRRPLTSRLGGRGP